MNAACRSRRAAERAATSSSSTIGRTSCSSIRRSSRISAEPVHRRVRRAGAEAGAGARLRGHPARRQHAGHGRPRDRGADPQPQPLGAHPDHLHHRRLRRRGAHGAGLLARRGRLHRSPVVPEILRAKVKVFVDLYSARAAGEAPGGGAYRAGRGESGARGRRAGEPRLSFLAQASVALAGSLDSAAITRELVRPLRAIPRRRCALTLAPSRAGSASTEVAWIARSARSGLLRRSVPSAGIGWLAQAIERVLKSGRAETVRQPTAIDAAASRHGRRCARA